jgi:anti-sigma B factor antagonist
MELTISIAGPAGEVLLASGALDLQSRDDLLEAGRTLLNGPIPTLVLDLAGITFIDSSGIGALVTLSSDAADSGIGFVLRNPSPRVTRILEITGLLSAWTIERNDAAPV